MNRLLDTLIVLLLSCLILFALLILAVKTSGVTAILVVNTAILTMTAARFFRYGKDGE